MQFSGKSAILMCLQIQLYRKTIFTFYAVFTYRGRINWQYTSIEKSESEIYCCKCVIKSQTMIICIKNSSNSLPVDHSKYLALNFQHIPGLRFLQRAEWPSTFTFSGCLLWRFLIKIITTAMLIEYYASVTVKCI